MQHCVHHGKKKKIKGLKEIGKYLFVNGNWVNSSEKYTFPNLGLLHFYTFTPSRFQKLHTSKKHFGNWRNFRPQV